MTSVSLSSASDQIAKMIGLPWERGGLGPDGFECWSFAAMFQDSFMGRTLPYLTAGTKPGRAVASERQNWRRTDTPIDGDIVEMRRFGRVNHVGVMVGGEVLHCQEGAGVVCDRLDAIRFMGWQIQFWTPDALQKRATANHRAIYSSGLGGLLAPDCAPDELITAEHVLPIRARTGETVSTILKRAGLSSDDVICFVSGPQEALPDLAAAISDTASLEAMLDDLGALSPSDWSSRKLAVNETLLVQSVPRGGGGSDPLRILLTIAITAAAAFVAGPLGVGAILGNTLGVSAAFGGQLVFGAVSILGRLAVSALLPPPSPSGVANFSQDVSPTFTAGSQTSVARPGAPVPIQFGRHLHLLDDIGPAWANYSGNTQILYQVLSLGEGEHDLEEVRLGSVAVWKDGVATENLPGVQIQHVAVNQPVTLFEDQVYTQPDVAGQTVENGTPVGWHIAPPVGIFAEIIEIDIVFRQLVHIDANGNDQNTTVDLRVEAQMLDANDDPLGSVIALDDLSFTAASRSAVRSSHRWFLPKGRYQVRVSRLTAESAAETFDEAAWAGLKAILPPGRTYGDMEVLAVRVEVGEQIAAQNARRVSAIKTRKLPIYSNDAWTAPQPTREIAWAAAEILRRHNRLDDIDLDELLALHETWTVRGDKFDTIFDQRLSFWEALQAVLRTGRSQPDQLGRLIRIWRDQPAPIPRQLFSERNIRRGSFVMRPILSVSTRPEKLVAPFMDETTWRANEISVGALTGRERRERYFGIVNKAHLAREVAHDWRASRVRSLRVEFEAELENRLLRRGDPIAIAHREITKGFSVGVVEFALNEVHLSFPILQSELGDTPRLALTAPDGMVWGPVAVILDDPDTPTDRIYLDPNDVQLVIDESGSDPRDWVPQSAAREEAIRAVIGPDTEKYQRVIVESVGQERDGYAPVSCLIDDPRAHDLEVDVNSSLEGAIAGLTATLETVGNDTMLNVELSISAGFDVAMLDFVHEYSTDGGIVWLPLAETSLTMISMIAPVGVTNVRSAAVSATRGPWVSAPISGIAGGLAAPTGLAEATAGDYDSTARLHVTADVVVGAVSYQFEVRDDGGALAGTISRFTPELDLSAGDLSGLGGPWRACEVSLKGIDVAGSPGAAASLPLTNPAPSAPTGVILLGITFTWDVAPEADVSSWQISAPWLSMPEIVTTNSFYWPYAQQGTATVRAIDSVGTGPGTSYTNPYQPPPPGK